MARRNTRTAVWGSGGKVEKKKGLSLSLSLSHAPHKHTSMAASCVVRDGAHSKFRKKKGGCARVKSWGWGGGFSFLFCLLPHPRAAHAAAAGGVPARAAWTGVATQAIAAVAAAAACGRRCWTTARAAGVRTTRPR